MKLFFSCKFFISKKSRVEIFHYYFLIFVLSHFLIYQNLNYLILAILLVFSILIHNWVFSKILNLLSDASQKYIRDSYFFVFNITLMFILIYDSTRENDYLAGYINGLEIAIGSIILSNLFSQKNVQVFFILITYLIIQISTNDSDDFRFRIHSFIFPILYGFNIFLEKTKKRYSLIKKKTDVSQKIKLENENYKNFDLAFLSSNDKIFILNKHLKFLYCGAWLKKYLVQKEMTIDDYLNFLKSSKFKIKKEYENYVVSEEVKQMFFKNICQNDFELKFHEIYEYIFNENLKNVFLILECNSSDETQILFIQKLEQDVLFIFKSNPTCNFIEEKTIIIENYSKTISYVSHEFRTPLNCIINMLQSLQNNLDRTLINSFIVPSLISSKFLLNLVNDLLDGAQMEAGKFKLVLSDFNLRAILDDSLQLFSFQARSREIDLKLLMNEGIEIVMSDSNRLRQIIINLLSNSFKYTLPGGSISLTVDKCDLNYINISVSDTGLGIKEEDLSKLFKEFSKITDSKNSSLNSNGIGLGLVISNKLAHQLSDCKGGIMVKSEFGKGSTFSFQFKDHSAKEIESMQSLSCHSIKNKYNLECKMITFIKQGGQEEKHENFGQNLKIQPNLLSSRFLKCSGGGASLMKAKSNISSQSLSSTKNHFFFETSSFKNITNEDCSSNEQMMEKKNEYITSQMNQRKGCGCPLVLVVDDNDFNNMAISFHFKRLKIPIITTISAKEALDKIKKQSERPCCKYFKLIFLDLEMPFIDGFKALNLFKQFHEEKGFPMSVVALTGHSEGSEKYQLAKSLMEDALVKPISYDDLVCLIDKLFRKIDLIPLGPNEFDDKI